MTSGVCKDYFWTDNGNDRESQDPTEAYAPIIRMSAHSQLAARIGNQQSGKAISQKNVPGPDQNSMEQAENAQPEVAAKIYSASLSALFICSARSVIKHKPQPTK